MNTLPVEILASLFTLFGVVITIFIRWLSLRRQVRYESLKIYADKLATIRLEVYPQVYKILSDAIKRIDFPNAFNEEIKVDLTELEKRLNAWDSENGILLSRESGDRAFKLRKILRSLIEHNQTLNHTDMEIYDDLKVKELREALKELEVGLRIDLSIYELEYGIVKHGFRGRVWWSNA